MIVHFLYKEYHATIFIYLIFRYLKHTAHYWHPKVHMKKWNYHIYIIADLILSLCTETHGPIRIALTMLWIITWHLKV